jgi:hypothetical protein
MPYPYAPRWSEDPRGRAVWHGPAYRTLLGVTSDPGGGWAWLRAPEAPLDPRHVVSVPLVDGLLQAAGLLGRVSFGVTALPEGFERLEVFGAPAGALVARLDLARAEDGLRGEIRCGPRGGPVWLHIQGYTARRLPT